MTLTNIFEKINPATTDVRFYEATSLCEPTIHTTTMNIDELWNDWWNECNSCPENGDFIYAVEFSDDGKVYFLDNTNYMEFTFEELMENYQKYFKTPDEILDKSERSKTL